MSRIKRLTQSYSKYVAVPWRDDAAAAQRVIFCVYHETEELRLRAKVDEFEIATRAAGHDWAVFDLTDSFPNWLASQRYVRLFVSETVDDAMRDHRALLGGAQGRGVVGQQI